MEKYLVRIEFRYSDIPKNQGRTTHNNKYVTIGVYDTFEDACIHGNKLLETLESNFPLHVYPDGTSAKKDRFSLTGGCFSSKNTLITNLAYLKTPFEFYAKIETLRYTDIQTVITDVIEAEKRYKRFKLNESEK